MVMTDTDKHYEELLKLADSLIDNLDELIASMPYPETTRANWGHIGTMLEFNRNLSEISCYLHKQMKFWETKEAERNVGSNAQAG